MTLFEQTIKEILDGSVQPNKNNIYFLLDQIFTGESVSEILPLLLSGNNKVAHSAAYLLSEINPNEHPEVNDVLSAVISTHDDTIKSYVIDHIYFYKNYNDRFTNFLISMVFSDDDVAGKRAIKCLHEIYKNYPSRLRGAISASDEINEYLTGLPQSSIPRTIHYLSKKVSISAKERRIASLLRLIWE